MAIVRRLFSLYSRFHRSCTILPSSSGIIPTMVFLSGCLQLRLYYYQSRICPSWLCSTRYHITSLWFSFLLSNRSVGLLKKSVTLLYFVRNDTLVKHWTWIIRSRQILRSSILLSRILRNFGGQQYT